MVSQFILALAIAAAYFVRRQYLINVYESCQGDQKSCQASIITFMNITSLLIIGLSFLFSRSASVAALGLVIGMLINTNLLIVEMPYWSSVFSSSESSSKK